MNIAIVGCGFVADHYAATLVVASSLRLQGLSEIGWGIWGTGVFARDVAANFPMVIGTRLRAVAARSQVH